MLGQREDVHMPVLAGDENLGGVNETYCEPCVVHRFDRVCDLNDVRPQRALGDTIRLRLEPTSLKLRRFRLDVRVIERLSVRMVVVHDDEGCWDRQRSECGARV